MATRHWVENFAMTPKKKAILERCIEDGLSKARFQIEDSRTKPNDPIADDLRFDAILAEIEDAFDFDREFYITLGEHL